MSGLLDWRMTLSDVAALPSAREFWHYQRQLFGDAVRLCEVHREFLTIAVPALLASAFLIHLALKGRE